MNYDRLKPGNCRRSLDIDRGIEQRIGLVLREGSRRGRGKDGKQDTLCKSASIHGVPSPESR
jgi:hypothetical protein